MANFINRIINKSLRVFGLKVSRTKNDDPHRIVKGLLEKRINIVLDVTCGYFKADRYSARGITD